MKPQIVARLPWILTLKNGSCHLGLFALYVTCLVHSSNFKNSHSHIRNNVIAAFLYLKVGALFTQDSSPHRRDTPSVINWHHRVFELQFSSEMIKTFMYV